MNSRNALELNEAPSRTTTTARRKKRFMPESQIFTQNNSRAGQSVMLRYEDENSLLKDKSPCAGVRADLKVCLLESDCVKVHGKTPRDCLKSGQTPAECQALRNTFFECKRSLLDARQRFRGRKGY